MVGGCGDVAGLSVEKATGIQGRPPPVEPTRKPSFISRGFGRLEKSKDRSKVSLASISGNGVRVGLSCAKANRSSRRGEISIGADTCDPCHKLLRT